MVRRASARGRTFSPRGRIAAVDSGDRRLEGGLRLVLGRAAGLLGGVVGLAQPFLGRVLVGAAPGGSQPLRLAQVSVDVEQRLVALVLRLGDGHRLTLQQRSGAGKRAHRPRAFAVVRRHGGRALVLVAGDVLRQFQRQLGKRGHGRIHEQMRSPRPVWLMDAGSRPGCYGAPRLMSGGKNGADAPAGDAAHQTRPPTPTPPPQTAHPAAPPAECPASPADTAAPGSARCRSGALAMRGLSVARRDDGLQARRDPAQARRRDRAHLRHRRVAGQRHQPVDEGAGNGPVHLGGVGAGQPILQIATIRRSRASPNDGSVAS